MQKDLCQIELVILDSNTWNYLPVCTLDLYQIYFLLLTDLYQIEFLVLDCNTWNHLTLCKGMCYILHASHTIQIHKKDPVVQVRTFYYYLTSVLRHVEGDNS